MEDFAKGYPQYAHLLPVRESIYKLNRLEGLRTSVAIQQLQIGAREQAEARAFFEQLALRYANAAAEQMGFGSSFYRLDHEMLRLVVGNQWCRGKDFSERIWDNRTALTQTLQNEIVNCFIRGDDLKKTSRILQQKFMNVSQKNIERLVFTENSYLANEASIRVFEQEPDIQKYQFLATADARTCEVCNELNEQVFRISERSAGVNFPPMHPWCRCFAIPVWEESGRRGLTNGVDGGIIIARDVKSMIRAIEQPIEQQHTGKGNPNAILTFDVPLNNRQEKLLAQLPDYDSRTVVPKGDVNMADLAALTAKTGHEFAMFTKGQERLVIRGNETSVNIDVGQAEELAMTGYRWSGHTHPGIDFLAMQPSDGDYRILDCFGQENSVIFNSKGDFRTFEKRGD